MSRGKHPLLVLAALALLVAATGCKKSDAAKSEKGAEPASPSTGEPAEPGEPTSAEGPGAAPATPELPPPDKFAGEVRIVNLYRDAEGKTQAIDLWAVRSFSNGPLLLAENVAFGAASDWARAPEGQSIYVKPAGAGADADDLGGFFSPAEGDRITGILIFESGSASVGSYWERSAQERSDAIKAPPAGKGLVVLRAGQLWAWDESLRETVGGGSFNVGDGAGACRHQRVEDEGFQASVLGGTQPVLLDLDPGTATITLHRWPASPDSACSSDPVYRFDVEVPASGGVMVLLYTPDGKQLQHLQIPLGIE
jgi:hypothetical protein